MLHAKIVPIGRLPKHLEEFDYLVPPELETVIKAGQLVRIPLRNSEVFGVVFLILENSSESVPSLKSIIALCHTEPVFSPAFLLRLKTLGLWYGVAVSTLLKMSLLPLQKRKLQKIQLTPLPTTETKNTGVFVPKHFFKYTDQNEHSAYLQNILTKPSGQTLILVPELCFLSEVMSLLSEEQQQNTVIWHGDLSDKEKFSRWLDIRNGEKSIILGTRSAIWLPFFDLHTVIIDYEHHREFKHSDQNPRFHVKDIVELIQSERDVTVHFISFSLSPDSYLLAHKQGAESKSTKPQPNQDTTLIDMRTERSRKNYGPLSHTAEQALRELQGDAFLFVQRRGSATGLGCLDCGYSARCPTCQNPFIYHEDDARLHCHYCKTTTLILLTCPQCHSTLLRLVGAGTQLLETTVRSILGGHSDHMVIRIDGDVNDQNYEHEAHLPRVVIGTEKALPYIRWDQTRLIVCVDIDRQISMPEFLATENVWQFLAHLNFYRPANSALLLQTRNPEQLLLQSLSQPERFYRHELNSRHRFVYPPHCYLVRYLYGHEDPKIAQIQAEKVYQNLQIALTNAQKSIKVLSPMPLHPLSYRGKYWYGIIAKISPKTWQTDLPWLNRLIPGGNWRIDPHPNSLLSL